MAIDAVSLDEQNDVIEIENDDSILEDVDETVISEESQENLQASNTVTNDTFFNYFESDGTLKSDVTSDELVFEGEFANIPDVHYITINKTIKLTGKNAIMNNISFVIYEANDVIIDSFTINTDDATNAVSISNSKNVKLINNNITFNAIGDDDYACAIYADAVDILTFQNNRVAVIGNRSGNKIVSFVDCEGAVVDGNVFVATLPSTGYQTGAIHFNDASSNLIFSNNKVDVSGISEGYYPTSIAVAFAGNNVTLTGNEISVSDDVYSYGVCALGSDSKIVGNVIKVSSPNYACGVNLEGSSITVVDNNGIIVSSDKAAYGIYSGMTSGGLIGVYSNNNISVSGYFAAGASISSFNESIVGNTIDLTGNYTIGVAAGYCSYYDSASESNVPIPIVNRLVKDNVINSLGSNVGTDATGDWTFTNLESTGITDVAGNLTIENNNIKSSGNYAIDLGNNNANVTNNTLIAAKSSGDMSIANKGNAVVSGSSPEFKTILFASDLTKTEGAADQFIVTAIDENGNAIVNRIVSISINNIVQNATTDEKGVAKFNIDLATGTYTVQASFAGDKVYGQKTISNTIKVNAKPAPAPAPVVVKKATKITAKKKTFKAKTKTKKYAITLKSGKTALKKVKVTLKIKGKTYKAYTNAKGKATFKIKNLKKKGKYTATIKFAGNKNYKATSKKVKITVKK